MKFDVPEMEALAEAEGDKEALVDTEADAEGDTDSVAEDDALADGEPVDSISQKQELIEQECTAYQTIKVWSLSF